MSELNLDFLKPLMKRAPRLTNEGHVFGTRLFCFPGFTLLGIGVGSSSDLRVQRFCRENSRVNLIEEPFHDGKFNTWYFNSGDRDGDRLDAKALFHYFPVEDNPIYSWGRGPFRPIVAQFPLMIETAEKYGYLAFGCDGNKHRGPTVFAAFLCLAGASPKEATRMANEIFGSNFVLPFVRRRIAKLGWVLGNEQPELRLRLRRLMGLE